MDTAKIFENGRSQAVRLPQKYRFNADEVVIQRLGDGCPAGSQGVSVEHLYGRL